MGHKETELVAGFERRKVSVIIHFPLLPTQVINLEDCVAVSMNYVDGSNFERAKEAQIREATSRTYYP